MITNQTLQVILARDGVNFTLQEHLFCKTWDGRLLRAIIGSTSDGMSGGKLVKAALQDTETFFSCVFHDACYRNTIEESTDGGVTWSKYTPTFAESNQWLRQNVIDSGADEVKATIIYLGVSSNEGQTAFNEDRGIKS